MNRIAVWIRVAGNASNIRANDPHGWRCFVRSDEGVSAEIPLLAWSLSGNATGKNAVPGIEPRGDEHGLLAWIDFYGDCTVSDGVLRIELKDPQ